MVAPLFRRKGFPQPKFPVQLNTQLPTATVPSSEYLWGTHAVATHNAENVKSAVFRSVAAATVVVTGVAAFISAPQQAYADVQPFVQKSLVSGQTTPVIPRVSGAPQQADLTLQAVFSRPITSPQGPTVRPFTAAPLQVDLTQQAWLKAPTQVRQGAVPPPVWQGQADPSQLASSIWSPASTPVVITPNPIAGFFVVPPQNEERPTRQVWPSQFAGQTTPVLPFTIGGPQRLDFTQQAMFTPAAITQVVIITGPTVFPNAPVPPQADTTVNASVVWTPSTFSPSAPVLPVVDTATPGRTLQGRLLRPPFTVESDEDKRARRAREAAEDAPKAEKAPDLSAYYKQSARISKAISDARAEADTLRPKIAELEAKAAKAKLTAKLEKQLLHAQQKLTLISVQEAVLLEESEAIDVAFIALIAYMQATS